MDAYQLDHGKVFLPPEVLLHVRTNCCKAVVAVHDGVDERVYSTDEKRYKSKQHTFVRLVS